MQKQQSHKTAIRRLREIARCAINSDFTSSPQDIAILFAIEAIRRNAKIEKLRDIAAGFIKDGECATCKKDGFDPNPNCNDHKPFDMPNDDAVDALAELIDMAREVEPHA